MIKTRCTTEFNGKAIKKMFVEGNIIKGEVRNNLFIITLASYRGKDVDSEFTNIAVTDQRKIDFIKKLKKGTQLFCEVNVTEKESNGKIFENLYLFNFVLGREGKGDAIMQTDADSTQLDEFI